MGSALGSYDLDVTTNTISGQKANTSHIHLLRVNVRSWSAIYATLWGATFRNIYYLVILHWQLALKKNTFPHKQFRGKGWGEMLAGERCIDWQTGLCGSLSLPTSHFFPEAGRCSPRGGRDERQTAWGMCGSTSVHCSAGLGFCAMSTQPRDFCLVCSFARLSAWCLRKETHGSAEEMLTETARIFCFKIEWVENRVFKNKFWNIILRLERWLSSSRPGSQPKNIRNNFASCFTQQCLP